MNNLQSTAGILILVLSCAVSPAIARKWTDNTGNHTVEAELVDVRDGKAFLKRLDGKVVHVPLSRLSEADRSYIESAGETSVEAPQTPAAGGPSASEDALQANLAQLDQRTEREAIDLLRDLSAEDDDTQYHACNKLLAIRPLPAAAVEGLRQLLTAPKPSTRQRAAAILVLHQRDNQRNLAAVKHALTIEKDEETKAFLARAVEHLRITFPTPNVLDDSGELDRLIESALLKVSRQEGRKLSQMAMTQPKSKQVVSGTIDPLFDDLPETLLLEAPDGPVEATLGWRWEITYRDEKPVVSGNQMKYSTENRQVQPALIGAVLHVGDQLRLSNSKIPSGTILLHTTFGWSVLSPEQVVPFLQSQLEIEEPLRKHAYPDVRETAALGAALLGPAAKALVPTLLTSRDQDTIMVMYRVIALERVAGKSALSSLRDWRQKHEGSKGITDFIDRAITALEK